MRILPLVAAVAALLVPAAPAFAGDPTMPLWQVHGGMQCTGYSVIQGTTISTFDVQVLDVAAGEAAGIGNILVRCPGRRSTRRGSGRASRARRSTARTGRATNRVIGAISQSVNEYGGKVALATSIEAILGTPIDVPKRAATTSARMKAAMAKAKPIASPLSVSGLSAPLAKSLTAAAAKAGRPVLAVPPGPLGSFPPADAAARLGGRGRLLQRRRADERDRHGGLRRRRPGLDLRPRARGQRPARAAAAGRLRLPDHQQPAAARRARLDLQAGGLGP